MTRTHGVKRGVHTSGGTAKETVRNAAEAMAPYADAAREQGRHLAGQCAHTARHVAAGARERLAPKVADLAHDAHRTYEKQVVPKVSEAAYLTRAVALPTAQHAVQDAAHEAASRSTAALRALRGQVTPAEIAALSRRRHRRRSAARAVRTVAVLGAVGAGALAAWRWWDRQANPEWLVEPPEATEVGETYVEETLVYRSEDSAAEAVLDPEVQAKQSEEELLEDAASDPADATRTSFETYEREARD
ncbi:DUF5324 family protein [Streptomyces polyrhachis]|uniref:DUF5324 family protein n=1 Tax=Streptomyces polyrhachis TaxID=1282885 RepID=A0ABW2G8S5_9ACTN